MSKKIWLFVVVPVLATVMAGGLVSPALAGAHSGGGGDGVLLPGDDRVVLADHYFNAAEAVPGVPGNQFQIPQEIRQEMNRVARILTSLYANEEFVKRQILEDNNEYYLVDAIPGYAECENRMGGLVLPSGAQDVQVACTVDKMTWLRKDLFLKMNIRDQVLLLVHEGLRRLNIASPRIAEIIQGLNVALDLMNRQLMGKRDLLADSETVLLSRMFKAIYAAGLTGTKAMDADFSKLEPAKFWRRGGGLVWTRFPGGQDSPVIDASAYLGVGTTVYPKSRIGANSELIASDLCKGAGCEIGDNTRVINSSVGAGVLIHMSQIDAWVDYLPVRLAQDVLIRNSSVTVSKLKVEAGVQIIDSAIDGSDWGRLVLKQGAVLSDVSVVFNTDLTVGRNSRLENLPGAKYTSGVQGFIGMIRSPSWTKLGLEIPAGTAVDFGNRIVCPTGKNEFLPYNGMFVRARTVEDFAKVCAKAPKHR